MKSDSCAIHTHFHYEQVGWLGIISRIAGGSMASYGGRESLRCFIIGCGAVVWDVLSKTNLVPVYSSGSRSCPSVYTCRNAHHSSKMTSDDKLIIKTIKTRHTYEPLSKRRQSIMSK